MSFHKDFLYGFATAAAQIEGGGITSEKLSGRGDSVSHHASRASRAILMMLDLGRVLQHPEQD
jgi:beta-glucosidase/6-phospho-beta-glucosidase/beta-galactosidase